MDSLAGDFDPLDLQRIGLMLLAAADMSTHHYVLVRRTRRGAWRVNVMHGNYQHVSSSRDSLLLALDRALVWLRIVTKPLGNARIMLHLKQCDVGRL